MNFSILNFFSILIISFPIFLISGPFIPELILGFASIYINFLIIKNKDFYYYKNKYTYFFLILWIYLLFNSIFSENPMWSLKTAIFYFRYYIFSISIYYLIENKFIEFNKLKFCLSITFLILILDLFIQYNTGKNILGFVAKDNRYSSFFGDELILGSYMIKFFPLLLFTLIFNSSFKNNKFYLIAIFSLLIISLFLTGERTATILGVFSIFLFLVILIKDIKTKIIYLILLMLIPILLISTNSKLKKRFIDDTLIYISSSNYEKYLESHSKEKKKYLRKKYIYFLNYITVTIFLHLNFLLKNLFLETESIHLEIIVKNMIMNLTVLLTRIVFFYKFSLN